MLLMNPFGMAIMVFDFKKDPSLCANIHAEAHESMAFCSVLLSRPLSRICAGIALLPEILK